MAAQRLAQLAVRCSAAAAVQPQQVGLLAAAAQRLLHCTGKHQWARQVHASSWQRDQQAPDSEQQRKALVNRLLYRSRQRGFLELDLLVGMWAEKELPQMSVEQMREFEVVLGQENPDMFKWLTAQAEAPEELRHNRTFAALQAHVQALRDRHHSVPRAAGEAPKEWVRGWSDSGKDLGSGGLASSSGGGGGSRAGGSS